MKFLDCPELETLNAIVNRIELVDRLVEGRFEAYSCKQVNQDKRLAKLLDERIVEELNRSPKSPDHSLISSSPFGPLTNVTSRKMLIYLISLLNSSFPDYDFSGAKAEEFQREDYIHAQTTINSFLGNCFPRDQQTSFLNQLWRTLEETITIRECLIFSYIPQSEEDPLAAPGAYWNFNFFFFNKTLKRIVFFMCRSTNKHRAGLYRRSRGDGEDEDGEDDEGSDGEDMDPRDEQNQSFSFSMEDM